MKLIALSIFLLLITACSTLPSNKLTQVATINGLLAGVYDGEISLKELSKYGDFGLGTFQAVDGEMVLLDGIFYQVKSDGSVDTPLPKMLTPFAAVLTFNPNFYADLSGLDLEALKQKLDELIPDQNRFVALRIDGTFSRIQTRSSPIQQKPYPPLTDVVKKQSVFKFENVKGTLVGLRCPPFVKGLNIPGYHFHFLTEDRTEGGHVLSLELAKGILAADSIQDEFLILLPKKTSGSHQVDLSQDRSKALEIVEK